MLCRKTIIILGFSLFHAEDGINDDGKRDMMQMAITVMVMIVLVISILQYEILFELSDSLLIVRFGVRHKLPFKSICNF